MKGCVTNNLMFSDRDRSLVNKNKLTSFDRLEPRSDEIKKNERKIFVETLRRFPKEQSIFSPFIKRHEVPSRRFLINSRT